MNRLKKAQILLEMLHKNSQVTKSSIGEHEHFKEIHRLLLEKLRVLLK